MNRIIMPIDKLLPSADLNKLLQTSRTVEYEAGQFLVPALENVKKVFFVSKGKLGLKVENRFGQLQDTIRMKGLEDVTATDVALAADIEAKIEYPEGSFALYEHCLYEQFLPMTLFCKVDARVIEIDGNLFKALFFGRLSSPDKLNRHLLALIAGIQSNYLLKNLPLSIALNMVNNCPRFVRTRGSMIYKQGDAFNGSLNLLLAGEAQIFKKVKVVSNENAELIENRETSDLFVPKSDCYMKQLGSRRKGEFVESEVISVSGRRQETVVVDSEAALVLSIDVNLLLAVDKTFSLVNHIYDTIVFQQSNADALDQRLKKTGLMAGPPATGSSEAAIRAKLAIDPRQDEAKVFKHVTREASEPKKRQGFNTLIAKVPRSRDRSLLAAKQQAREETRRVTNSPALNKSLYADTSAKSRSKRLVFLDPRIFKTTQSRSVSRRHREPNQEQERIEKAVKDDLDRVDRMHDLLTGDRNAICSLG